MAVQRWLLVDPADPDPSTRSYLFPRNPEKMSSPFPERNVTFEGTTSVDGQPIMWEAQSGPAKWSFAGKTADSDHYEAMRHWTYERTGRLWLYDHFGRRLTVTLTKFDAEPKRALGRYWKHEYTESAWVYQVTAPTYGLGE